MCVICKFRGFICVSGALDVGYVLQFVVANYSTVSGYGLEAFFFLCFIFSRQGVFFLRVDGYSRLESVVSVAVMS